MPAVKLNPKVRAAVKKAIKQILAEPDSLDMRDWFGKSTYVHTLPGACGTTACLAGHLILASGAKLKSESEGNYWTPTLSVRAAKERLGVKVEPETDDRKRVSVRTAAIAALNFKDTLQADSVFIWQEWPARFRKKFTKYIHANPLTKETLKAQAQVAVDRFNHFLKTGR